MDDIYTANSTVHLTFGKWVSDHVIGLYPVFNLVSVVANLSLGLPVP